MIRMCIAHVVIIELMLSMRATRLCSRKDIGPAKPRASPISRESNRSISSSGAQGFRDSDNYHPFLNSP